MKISFNLFIPQVTKMILIYDQVGHSHLMYYFGFVLIIEYFKSSGFMFPTLWSTLICERRLKVSLGHLETSHLSFQIVWLNAPCFGDASYKIPMGHVYLIKLYKNEETKHTINQEDEGHPMPQDDVSNDDIIECWCGSQHRKCRHVSVRNITNIRLLSQTRDTKQEKWGKK